MFKLHALSVDTLAKIRRSMNRVIIGRERSSTHPIKDVSFDILSLADQLHRSKSTIPQGPEPGKLYFSGNKALDLLMDGIEALERNVHKFNESILKDEILSIEVDTNDESSNSKGQEVEEIGQVEEMFCEAQDETSMTSYLTNLYL